jgi:hypothetical protein
MGAKELPGASQGVGPVCARGVLRQVEDNVVDRIEKGGGDIHNDALIKRPETMHLPEPRLLLFGLPAPFCREFRAAARALDHHLA